MTITMSISEAREIIKRHACVAHPYGSAFGTVIFFGEDGSPVSVTAVKVDLEGDVVNQDEPYKPV